MDYFSLKQRLTNLKEAHTTVYKQTFPGEKTVVRPVSQMRGKLKNQGTNTKSGVFFPLLTKLSVALSKVKATQITNINFRAKKGILKIDFLAPDFSSIQRLQIELEAQNLSVSPGASNASGDKYFGRLTIKEKS
jgi:type II secretion system protein L